MLFRSIELHTGTFADAEDGATKAKELARIKAAVSHALKLGRQLNLLNPNGIDEWRLRGTSRNDARRQTVCIEAFLQRVEFYAEMDNWINFFVATKKNKCC